MVDDEVVEVMRKGIGNIKEYQEGEVEWWWFYDGKEGWMVGEKIRGVDCGGV